MRTKNLKDKEGTSLLSLIFIGGPAILFILALFYRASSNFGEKSIISDPGSIPLEWRLVLVFVLLIAGIYSAFKIYEAPVRKQRRRGKLCRQ